MPCSRITSCALTLFYGHGIRWVHLIDLWLDFHINEDFQHHVNEANTLGKKNKKKNKNKKNLFPLIVLEIVVIAVASSNQGSWTALRIICILMRLFWLKVMPRYRERLFQTFSNNYSWFNELISHLCLVNDMTVTS